MYSFAHTLLASACILHCSSQKILCSIGSANIKTDDGHIFVHCYSMGFLKYKILMEFKGLTLSVLFGGRSSW